MTDDQWTIKEKKKRTKLRIRKPVKDHQKISRNEIMTSPLLVKSNLSGAKLPLLTARHKKSIPCNINKK